jgi:hexosaminidase
MQLMAISQDIISIIPQPVSLQPQEGYLNAKKISGIVIESGHFQAESDYLTNALKENFNLILKPKMADPNVKPILLRQLATGDSAAYNLYINYEQIIIESAGKVGIFYGIQSLLQIMASSNNLQLLQLEVNDSPRFSWRGMHLDCSRHFFTVDEVKKYIDYLALYKMNVFHWHLTDDQGWRIEIKEYPKLTEVAAWRSGSMVGAYSKNQFDEIRYGGYYTQDQIREVVAYAAQRHITIVPEIEMPGHSLAALAAYPNLACKDSTFEVSRKWGVFDDVFCAGNEEVFEFLQDVLDEVITLFPSEYIHIGGDECPKTRWKTCDKCQQRIADEQLRDEHHLQSYFIQRMEQYLNAKGRKIIGWDEILEGGLAPNAAVMSWRGTKGGIAAAQAGHFAVMTPGKPCYFDHYQSENKNTEPHAIGGLNTLADVYNYEPIPESLNSEQAKFILGAQGNVWTEYILNFAQVEYMALPRMAALSEVLWTPASLKSYPDFVDHLKTNCKILDKLNTHYAKHFLNEKR